MRHNAVLYVSDDSQIYHKLRACQAKKDNYFFIFFVQ